MPHNVDQVPQMKLILNPMISQINTNTNNAKISLIQKINTLIPHMDFHLGSYRKNPYIKLDINYNIYLYYVIGQ